MIVINEKLLDEFRTPGRCEWCGKRCDVREPHHASARGMGGGKRLDIRCNLLAVGSSSKFCCACHTLIHAGGKSRADMVLDIIAERENTTPDTIREVVWLFNRLPKKSSGERMFDDAIKLPVLAYALFVREYAVAYQSAEKELGF